MTDNIFWLLELSIDDGKLDEFKRLAEEMSAATRNEAGAIAYEWFLGADNATCHIYERYSDNAATLVHLGNFGARFAERFMGCVTPTSFDVYGPADDQVRGGLAGMGAVHYDTQLAGFSR